MSTTHKQRLVGEVKRAALLQALRDLGKEGGISTDLADAAETHDTTVTKWLRRMSDDGSVGCWPDPTNRAGNRIRWWAIEFLPAAAPVVVRKIKFVERKEVLQVASKASREESQRAVAEYRGKVLVLPGFTHDPRYQVAPGARVDGAGFAALGVGRYLNGPRA